MPRQDIKLIALDLDGTLLCSDKTISDTTLAAIQAARNKGVIVAIATGRMYSTAKRYGAMLNLGDMPMMLYAGGLIQTVETKKVLYNHPIAVEDAAALLALDKEKGWQMQTYIDDVLRVAAYDSWIQGYEHNTGAKAVVCGDDFYTPQGAPNKMLSRGSHEELLLRKAEIEKVLPDRFNIMFSEGTFLEVMPKGVNKGDGLRRLGNLFGVTIDQVMAMGDSQNDIDMLRAAGFSVAMGNAADEIKDAAQAVTLSNDDDGVAAAIERFVL
ncbi:MAG: Cof-type HAD-IIB family hydrolase [Megasphaera sp.]|jgi:Cof subfamily protein (haloacid dehalogenase superfamily)|nr:Cof-type HAD-IIB family hydrolase [Megasphaera sp.]MCH4218495.1 Cof-type HAD-IIB family hydrolase [Megasphaera sp.]